MENEQYYWSPSGKRYHESRSCPHLKNVQNPLHGNLQSAKHGGRTPCSHCCTVSPAVVQSVNEGFDIDYAVLYVSDGSPLYHLSPQCNYFKYNKTKYRTNKQGAIASGHIRPCALCAYNCPELSDDYYKIPPLPENPTASAPEKTESVVVQQNTDSTATDVKRKEEPDSPLPFLAISGALLSFFLLTVGMGSYIAKQNKQSTRNYVRTGYATSSTATRTPKPSNTTSQIASNRITYTVTASAKMLENNSVGKEWSYYFEINGKPVGANKGVAINVKKGESIPFYVQIVEHDSIDDIGTHSGTITATEGSFYVDDIYVTVRENRGRYTGNTARFRVTYSFLER